jgi:hypothetical protein
MYSQPGSTANNASAALKVVSGSYKPKTTFSATRPPLALIPLGTFTQGQPHLKLRRGRTLAVLSRA